LAATAVVTALFPTGGRPLVSAFAQPVAALPRHLRGCGQLTHSHQASKLRRCGSIGAAQVAGQARELFLAVLEEKGGDWRDAAVMAELERLERANPTVDPALTGDYLDANWVQVTRPDYNYGGSKGSVEYTLGALSFNMYEPSDMKVLVEETTQLVAPKDDGQSIREWDISLRIRCIDERYPPFLANITTFGEIKPSKDKEGKHRRLEVWFREGQLKLVDGADAAMREKWLETVRSAQQQKKRTIGTILKNGMLRLMMGLRLPRLAPDGVVSFQMKRPPHGYTDILYLDDKLRVTRGNRGSIVAVVRERP